MEKVTKVIARVEEGIETLFDLEKLSYKLEEIEMKLQEPTVWNDPDKAQSLTKTQKQLSTQLEMYISMKKELEDLKEYQNLYKELDGEEAVEIEKEAISIADSLLELFEKKELESKLSGEYDSLNCILTIHAGTGGTDAMDWAEMLLRMYRRHADDKGYAVNLLSLQESDEAGIKSATLQIQGLNAYGFLKSEKGVHRLVRISPFNANGKRQTSFASVDVMPELEDISGVEISETDLRIDTYRSSGAGGQHVNTTDSAVRITHIPTGVVVSCQNERSQISNRATAMKMLVAKLIEIKEREHKEKISDIAGDYSQIAWGSQIRSYVFHPYSLVKDHRTGAETSNVSAVMDGEIDIFVDAFLKGDRLEENS